MTEMASSLLNQRSLCSSGMETDLLETFTVPYDEKEGYTVVDGDTESFCVSIDFGLESDDPFVFPTVDEPARKKSRALSEENPVLWCRRVAQNALGRPYPRNLDPATTRKEMVFAKLYQIPVCEKLLLNGQ